MSVKNQSPITDMDRTENCKYNSSVVACVFVAEVTFLQSRRLATIGGYTDWWEGFMKYAAEIGSGVS
jgi:hypothetical protein